MSHRDPYKIWLFEIIMQQTRISQGTPYYNSFIEKYPSVQDLAFADIDDVLKLWEGLGYYSRARNLHFAAKQVCNEYAGEFPTSSTELLKLKGIGKYTSAAIASFASDEKIGVVDGNVYRVLSRVFGIADPIDETKGQKKFYQLAQDLLDQRNPAKYNQAIMDFGALQCVPKNPNCKTCTLKNVCVAKEKNKITTLPVKAKKLIKKTRYFNYLEISYKASSVIRKRVAKDIWKLLYELPYIENKEKTIPSVAVIKNWLKKELAYDQSFDFKNEQKVFKQQLTHQTIIGSFYKLELTKKPKVEEPYKLLKTKALKDYAFPKIIDCYLSDNSISLFK